MTSSSSASKRNRPAAALAPRQRWRAYTPEMAEEIRAILPLLEATMSLRDGVEMGYLSEEEWEPVDEIMGKILWQVINNIDLAGLEYRDDAGKIISVIHGIVEPTKGVALSSNTLLHHTKGVMTLEEFFNNLHQNAYCVCLPGCGNYRAPAMLETFWARLEARLKEWEDGSRDQEETPPPVAIFDEPEP
jgi:hypothetical protein